jgi:superfamily I DNA and/or RNA helicase
MSSLLLTLSPSPSRSREMLAIEKIMEENGATLPYNSVVPNISRIFQPGFPYDFYVENAGKTNDGQNMELFLATDVDTHANKELLKYLKNQSIRLKGYITKENQFYIRYINTAAKPLGFENNRRIRKQIKFKWEHDFKKFIPYDHSPLLNEVGELPIALVQKQKVEERIKNWEVYLELIERKAEENSADVQYSSYRMYEDMRYVQFFTEKIPKTLRNASVKWIDTTNIDEDDYSFSPIIGTVDDITSKGVKIELFDEYYESALKQQFSFSERGRLFISNFGELSQVRTLKRGLNDLKNGRALNPQLENILFDYQALEKQEEVKENPIKVEHFLANSLNDFQREAVEGALNSEDLYLIQGPPGTGKTTVIAEICYQNAIRGMRTLVASQSNLAVDNVISKLDNHPKIRALRKGNVKSIEVEGKAYTENEIIDTWLKSTSDLCQQKIDTFKMDEQDISHRQDFLFSIINRNQAINAIEEELTLERKRLPSLTRRKKALEAKNKTFLEMRTQLILKQKDYQQSLKQMDDYLESLPQITSGLDAVENQAQQFLLEVNQMDIAGLTALPPELERYQRISQKAAAQQKLLEDLREFDQQLQRLQIEVEKEAKQAKISFLHQPSGEYVEVNASVISELVRRCNQLMIERPNLLNVMMGKDKGWKEKLLSLHYSILEAKQSSKQKQCLEKAVLNKLELELFAAKREIRSTQQWMGNRENLENVLSKSFEYTYEFRQNMDHFRIKLRKLSGFHRNFHDERLEVRLQQLANKIVTTEQQWEDSFSLTLQPGLSDYERIFGEIQGGFHSIIANMKLVLAQIQDQVQEWKRGLESKEVQYREEQITINQQLSVLESELLNTADPVEELEQAAQEIEAVSNKIHELVQRLVDMRQQIPEELQDKDTAAIRDMIKDMNRQRELITLKKELSWDWKKKLESPSEGYANQLKSIYIQNANVIGITCVQSGSRSFTEEYPDFDMVIVDEVSKATPPELLLPLLKGKKAVLVGDHNQLPPMIGDETIKEVLAGLPDLDQDNQKGYRDYVKESIFEKLFHALGKENKATLRYQYRMHSHIMNTINQFYQDESGLGLIPGIKNEEEARAHHLAGKYVQPHNHVVWMDVPLSPAYREKKGKNGQSYYNEAEIFLIEKTLEDLNQAVEVLKMNQLFPNDKKKDVGIISFYGEQVKRIRLALSEERFPNLALRIGTVDRFQGMERSVIIASFVRNNPNGKIGFAEDFRRINVALSRAKELLIVTGCSNLFSSASGLYQNVLYEVAKVHGYKPNIMHEIGQEMLNTN